MDFSELRQMGEELIALGSQQVNENDDKNLPGDTTNINNTEDVFSNLQSSSLSNNYSSFTFPTSYRNVEPSIASTSYSSAIDDPLASAVSHNQNTSQHTYFNTSELLGINSLYKNQLGLGNAEFTSPPVMEDIEEGDEGATGKHFDDPVLHFHDPGRGVDSPHHSSSVTKDSQVTAQLLQQQLDGWNFNDNKHDSGDWNINMHLNGQGDLDTIQDFQQTFMNGNMLKKADQRENFDTSSLYFSTYGSDYAPSMDNFLDTRQFFPNPHQPLVSISTSSGASGVTASASSSAKVSTEKRFQPTKHRVARKELRTLPAKLEKAKQKKQQQQMQRLFQNQTTIPTTTSSNTTSNILQMPNLSSGNISSITSRFTRPTSASVSSASSYSAQSTSQQSYNKTIFPPPPPPPPRLGNQNHADQQELIQPSDMPETTRLIYTGFAQTKFVYYNSADDKRAKRSSVPDGFAGFACKHCEGKSQCADGNNSSSRKKPKFARCGRYFPSNIKTFADRSKTLNALVKHLGKCPLVPLETRNNLILFEQSHDEETKMKRLLNANYAQKDIFKVMWNRLHPGDCSE